MTRFVLLGSALLFGLFRFAHLCSRTMTGDTISILDIFFLRRAAFSIILSFTIVFVSVIQHLFDRILAFYASNYILLRVIKEFMALFSLAAQCYYQKDVV